jgi:putative hydrolase of the HAD superfamily
LPLASLVDVAVFSCLVGVTKPDPYIYQIATEKLDVQPQRCLYVADGMSQELVTASNLGMHAVQIFVPGEDEYDLYREEWHGPVISSLREILTLLR